MESFILSFYLSGVNIVYLIDCLDLTAGLFLPPEAGGEDSGLNISKIRIKLIIIFWWGANTCGHF